MNLVPEGLDGAGREGRWLNRARRELVLRDGPRCAGCGWDLDGCVDDWLLDPSLGFPWDVDHVVAITDGGAHALTNMQLLCQRCHRAKTAADRRARKETAGGRESKKRAAPAVADIHEGDDRRRKGA